MAYKHGLGKGLNALLPVDDESPAPGERAKRTEHTEKSSETKGGKVEKNEDVEQVEKKIASEILIPLEKLKANPDQPRKSFDDESLQELADSIKQHGVIQPIIVEDMGDGTYMIIAGERRSRAASIAGLGEIPVLVRNYTDEKRMEISLIENIQRTDLNPIEEAMAYKRLMDLTGLSQDEIAAKVGKKRSTVANTLRLLNLPSAIQESLAEGVLSQGHARALLSTPNSDHQEKLFQKIVEDGISVREAEKLAGESKPRVKSKDESPKRDAHLKAMEEKFIEVLGTKVEIDGDFNNGYIRIHYYSMEDLDRLYEILIKE